MSHREFNPWRNIWGSPEFIANMGTFATEIGYAADKMGSFLQWMGLIPPTANNASSSGLPQVSQVGAGLGRFGGGSKWNFQTSPSNTA